MDQHCKSSLSVDDIKAGLDCISCISWCEYRTLIIGEKGDKQKKTNTLAFSWHWFDMFFVVVVDTGLKCHGLLSCRICVTGCREVRHRRAEMGNNRSSLMSQNKLHPEQQITGWTNPSQTSLKCTYTLQQTLPHTDMGGTEGYMHVK